MRYEFGKKVTGTTTIAEGFVVGMRAMPGNPYDGHTLAEAIEQVESSPISAPTWPWSTAGIAGTLLQRAGS